MTLELQNLSGATIEGIDLSLVEQLTFKALGHVKNVERVVVTQFVQLHVEPHTTVRELEVRFYVPLSELPAPSFEGNFIKRSYQLKATVKLDKPFLVKLFERELVIPLTLVCCSRANGNNSQDIERRVTTTLGTGGHPGALLAPICVDDFFLSDEHQTAMPVRYQTFYSVDFGLPSELKEFDEELYELLKAQR